MKKHPVSYRIIALALLGMALTVPALATQLAFPGAEGYGKYTVGGRGGQVIQVTNLNDSGAGSFRAAVQTSGPRTVVFRVGGVIRLLSQLTITEPYLTIAGQTAPGGGILFTGSPITIKASEVIVRNIRRRYWHPDGISKNVDGITIASNSSAGIENVILDHCSVSWATDENVGVNGSKGDVVNVTIQNCIVSEGSNLQPNHSMGILLNGWKHFDYGPLRISVIRNLISNCQSRGPTIGDKITAEVVNNVIYNWKSKVSAMDHSVKNHFIGNMYEEGPGTQNGNRILDFHDVSTLAGFDAVDLYLSGNIAPCRPDNTYPEHSIIDPSHINVAGVDPEDLVVSSPFLPDAVTNGTSAVDAVAYVLANAGAFPRDVVDQRQITDFMNGTGAFVTHPPEPTLSGGTPPTDSDSDGMPDAWETANGHNNSVNDSAADADSDGYTNLEEYLNSFGFLNPITNAAPTVTLTAPADDATFTSPATVNFAATAADSDGTVTKVEFYNGVTKLGEDLSPPYTYSWTGVGTGSYAVKARAIDNNGAFTDSTVADIDVVDPSANIIIDDFEDGNANGWTTFGSGTWSVVTSGASKVHQQSNNAAAANGTLLDATATWTKQSVTASVKPLSFSGTNRFFGVIARAVNSTNYYYFILRSNNTIELKKIINGTSATLASASFAVATGTTYSLKLVADGTSLKAYIGDVLQLQATDSTFSSGNIGVVTFYTAAEIDNVVADPMSLVDVTDPTVSIVDPTNGLTVSDNIEVAATAADNVGVVGVQFKLDGANLGAEDTVAPYEVVWNTATAALGSHSLTAVARDAAGNSTMSSAISVTVAPASIVDDFEDGNANGWTVSGPGTWSVITDGTKVYSQSNNAVSATQSLLDGTAGWTDQSIELDVKAVSFSGSNRFFGVIVRAVDASNYYYFILRSNNTIELKKIINGTSSTLASDTFTVTTGTWRTLRLEASGNSLRAFIDDDQVLSATDSTYSSGKVGLVTFYTAANFADVVADSTP